MLFLIKVGSQTSAAELSVKGYPMPIYEVSVMFLHRELSVIAVGDSN